MALRRKTMRIEINRMPCRVVVFTSFYYGIFIKYWNRYSDGITAQDYVH